MSARTVGIRWKCVVFWGLIAWLSLSVLTYLFAGLLVDGSWEGRGQVGDMFGVVNSLISGAALVGVIAALFLQQRALEVQREDLKATQEELKLTREEHSKAAQAQAASAEQMGRQAESLKVTALVNAISSMLDTYNSEVGFLFE
ncbi:MAG: hypothetical protein OET90_05710, partial [Desulfuromonadales bacterium]|nr:hypothetical protein [Desulfuromonadales bacterium]